MWQHYYKHAQWRHLVYLFPTTPPPYTSLAPVMFVEFTSPKNCEYLSNISTSVLVSFLMRSSEHFLFHGNFHFSIRRMTSNKRYYVWILLKFFGISSIATLLDLPRYLTISCLTLAFLLSHTLLTR